MTTRRTRRMDLPHGEVRVWDEGPLSGPAVLLIHGLSYPLEVWEPVVQGLVAHGRRVIRYDLYGRGEAGHDGIALSHDVLVEQAVQVLNAADPSGPVSVVSLSNGDLIAVGLAARVPQQVFGLGLIAPSGLDPRTMQPWPRRQYRFLASLPGSHEWLRRKLIRRMHSHAAVGSEAAQELYRLAILRVGENPLMPRAVLSHLAHLPDADRVRSDLGDVHAAGLPLDLLCFTEEQDASTEGIAVFGEQAQHTLAQGGHMGLLDDAAPVLGWLLEKVGRRA